MKRTPHGFRIDRNDATQFLTPDFEVALDVQDLFSISMSLNSKHAANGILNVYIFEMIALLTRFCHKKTIKYSTRLLFSQRVDGNTYKQPNDVSTHEVW